MKKLFVTFLHDSCRFFLFLGLLLCPGAAPAGASTVASVVPEGVVLATKANWHPEVELVAQELTFLWNTDGSIARLEKSFDFQNWELLLESNAGSATILANVQEPAAFYRLSSSQVDSFQLQIAAKSNYQTNGFTVDLLFPFLEGWEHWVQVRPSCTDEWINLFATPEQRHFRQLTLAESASCEYRLLAKAPLPREQFESFLVAGQSNALLGLPANGVTNSNVLHLSRSYAFAPLPPYNPAVTAPFTHSFAITAAHVIAAQRQTEIMLVPTARGGTPISYWLPREQRYEISTPYGEVIIRAKIAAPQGIKAILYFGHESSSLEPARTTYTEDWMKLVTALREDLGSVPLFYAQLGKHTTTTFTSGLTLAAEKQRLLESGMPDGLPRHHMVVSFDLPLVDDIHLTPFGHHLLGERFAMALREHLYNEAVDGTGPRLRRIFHPSDRKTLIHVQFSQPINPSVQEYDRQFRVFAADTEIHEFRVDRAPSGDSVSIELLEEPQGPVSVSYGDVPASGPGIFLQNVVRNLHGLPAPTFAKQPVEGIGSNEASTSSSVNH